MTIIGKSVPRSNSATEINIAPLLDVMFILIIFFMVTTSFVRDAKIDLQRPTAATAEQTRSRSVRVSLGRDGSLFVDAKPTKQWLLQAVLKQMNRYAPIDSILLVADRDVKTERLVEIVDECRLAGFDNVALAVSKKQ